VFVQGAQLETGTLAHSLVPTTSASATCNADIISMASTNLPVAAGSVELDFTPAWSTGPSGGAFLVDSRGDVSPNTKGISLSVSSANQLTFAVGSVSSVSSSALTWVAGQRYRIRVVWGGGLASIYRDDVRVLDPIAITVPTTHATLNIGDGRLGTGAFAAEGYISNLRFYP
jgi:hypothetical protein